MLHILITLLMCAIISGDPVLEFVIFVLLLWLSILSFPQLQFWFIHKKGYKNEMKAYKNKELL